MIMKFWDKREFTGNENIDIFLKIILFLISVIFVYFLSALVAWLVISFFLYIVSIFF